MAPCTDCRGTFDPVCMEFDHVPERGPKLGNVGRFANDPQLFAAELAKCDLVCANCHAIRTKHRGLSQESRRRLSDKAKEAWTRPDVRKTHSTRLAAWAKSEEQVERQRARVATWHSDPEKVAKRNDAIRKSWEKRKAKYGPSGRPASPSEGHDSDTGVETTQPETPASLRGPDDTEKK